MKKKLLGLLIIVMVIGVSCMAMKGCADASKQEKLSVKPDLADSLRYDSLHSEIVSMGGREL